MRRALIDGYYSAYLTGLDSFEEWLPARLRPPAARFGWLRGMLLFGASLRRPTLVVVRVDRGWRSLLLLRAVFGREAKLVVLQFLLLVAPERGLPNVLARAWQRVDRWAVSRAVRTGLVLTAWEADAYAHFYGVGPERFRHVPWPWRNEPAAAPPPYAESGPIVAAGRAFCDWPTLHAALTDLPWTATVVCPTADAGRAAGAGVTVVCDMPAERYRALLNTAALAVFPMIDGGTSQGQIRLMEANEAGVPVIASDVRGLAGYVRPNETAVLVPPGDSAALGRAIDELMRSPQQRHALRAAAFRRSQRWTGPDYGRAVEEVIHGREPTVPRVD